MMSLSQHPAAVNLNSAKDFDYMPSRRRSGKRRNSFSILSGPRTAPFTYHSSVAIQPLVTVSAEESFNISVRHNCVQIELKKTNTQ